MLSTFAILFCILSLGFADDCNFTYEQSKGQINFRREIQEVDCYFSISVPEQQRLGFNLTIESSLKIDFFDGNDSGVPVDATLLQTPNYSNQIVFASGSSMAVVIRANPNANPDQFGSRSVRMAINWFSVVAQCPPLQVDGDDFRVDIDAFIMPNSSSSTGCSWNLRPPIGNRININSLSQGVSISGNLSILATVTWNYYYYSYNNPFNVGKFQKITFNQGLPSMHFSGRYEPCPQSGCVFDLPSSILLKTYFPLSGSPRARYMWSGYYNRQPLAQIDFYDDHLSYDQGTVSYVDGVYLTNSSMSAFRDMKGSTTLSPQIVTYPTGHSTFAVSLN
eukprot:TRINITY_DN2034_c0_g1_i2.p1 TRINITY_DN2034_c0_g1~~TRINITY_DN2034_c0_g1_i2.p1  ORF type:complete len:335 (+),score=38.85 TRINITY_DN2034_c0_g1_i2:42-1046(+)